MVVHHLHFPTLSLVVSDPHALALSLMIHLHAPILILALSLVVHDLHALIP